VAEDDQLGREPGEHGDRRLDDRLEREAAQVEAADDDEQPADAGHRMACQMMLTTPACRREESGLRVHDAKRAPPYSGLACSSLPGAPSETCVPGGAK
jgi:hypothetical protein